MRRPAAAMTHHCAATVFLHWGSVTAVVVAVAAIYLRTLFENDAVRLALLTVHRQLGLLVLLGLVLRLAVRFAVGMADHSGEVPAMLRWVATMCHIALYLILAAVPLLGWAATNAHELTLQFLGMFPLPNLVQPDSDLSDLLDDYHKWMAWALGGLVVMHASAALWHHFVRKDSVLRAMLPQSRSR
jgi:cytochrome b561